MSVAPESLALHESDSPKLGPLLSLHPLYTATVLCRQYVVAATSVLISFHYCNFFFISTVSSWLSLNFTIF